MEQNETKRTIDSHCSHHKVVGILALFWIFFIKNNTNDIYFLNFSHLLMRFTLHRVRERDMAFFVISNQIVPVSEFFYIVVLKDVRSYSQNSQILLYSIEKCSMEIEI